MPTLTYNIETVTRVNSLTSASATVKRVTPSIDGAALLHQYVFDGATADATAKASVKSDLETSKGYGTLTDG